MTTTTKAQTAAALTTGTKGQTRARRAAGAVAAFLGGFLVLNTYWGFGGRWGVAWVLGCDCTVPLAAVWVQEGAIVAGMGVVLGRAGLWRPALPAWIFGIGSWAMTASFAAVGLQNLLGDTTVQARLLFAPMAFTLCGLCLIVAQRRWGR